MRSDRESASANVRRIRRDEGAMIDVLGIYMEAKVTEAGTGGRYCCYEMQVPPGAFVPPHRHPQQETFYVVEGEAEFARLGTDGLEWLPVRTGDAVEVPGDVIHGFRNSGNSLSRILLTCTQGLETFFDEAGLPVPAGAPLPSSPPPPAAIERVVSIAIKHGQTFLPPEANSSVA